MVSHWKAGGRHLQERPGISLYHSLLPYLNVTLAQNSKETAWLTCFKFATLSHCDGFYKQHYLLILKQWYLFYDQMIQLRVILQAM